MPDRQKHRGPHPQDARLFLQPARLVRLRRAAADLAWLLERDYSASAALKLVGDRFQLPKRQRLALQRAVSAPSAARARRDHRLEPPALRGAVLMIDAFNQLITVEVALAGGILLRGSDGALRDLASVHGRYRRVEETERALAEIGDHLAELEVAEARFVIDRAVSNSGRLAARIRELAAARGWSWSAELVPSADPVLKHASACVATSDSSILDRTGRWYDLAGGAILRQVPAARIIDLIAAADPPAPESSNPTDRSGR